MTDTLIRIRKIIARIGLPEGVDKAEDVTPEMTLVGDLKLDSLDIVQLAIECEDEFKFSPGYDDDLEQNFNLTTTVADLARMVEELAGART